MRRIGWTLLLSGAALAADQSTKWLARALPETGVRLFPGLTLVRFLNPHLAGSIPVPEELILGASLGALALAALALRRSLHSGGISRTAGWALVLGGGLSNLGDRLFRGGVLDIIRLGPISYVNLADGLILLGIALVLIKPKKRLNRLSEEEA